MYFNRDFLIKLHNNSKIGVVMPALLRKEKRLRLVKKHSCGHLIHGYLIVTIGNTTKDFP